MDALPYGVKRFNIFICIYELIYDLLPVCIKRRKFMGYKYQFDIYNRSIFRMFGFYCWYFT